MNLSPESSIGFVGLGVMGAPMCRNIAAKHQGPVIAFDNNPQALDDIASANVTVANSLDELANHADIVFLSLPGSPQVRAVCTGDNNNPGTLAGAGNPPAVIVDLSTTDVASARSVATDLQGRGIQFADAPVARTREAAQRGELSIMVGASDALFEQIAPLLHYMGSDVTRCGDTGCGQVMKLTNNALVFENTLALAEMMIIAERAGVDNAVFLDALSKGSGDSFVARNHGVKAMQPRAFPDKSFPSAYAIKDLAYVLELAGQNGVTARVADLARRYYTTEANQDTGARYFPCVIELIDRNEPLAD